MEFKQDEDVFKEWEESTRFGTIFVAKKMNAHFQRDEDDVFNELKNVFKKWEESNNIWFESLINRGWVKIEENSTLRKIQNKNRNIIIWYKYPITRYGPQVVELKCQCGYNSKFNTVFEASGYEKVHNHKYKDKLKCKKERKSRMVRK